MQDALAAVEALYFGLQQQVGMIVAATTSTEQKNAFMSQYVAARTAYWNCVNKMFHDDDPKVAALTTQLQALNQQVSNFEKQLGEISKVLDIITQAATIASDLSSMAIG